MVATILQTAGALCLVAAAFAVSTVLGLLVFGVVLLLAGLVAERGE